MAKIEGVLLTTHTRGTNIIRASAKWDNSDILNKISQIRNIPNIKDIAYTIDKYIGRIEFDLSKTTFFTTEELIREGDRARIDKYYFKSLICSWVFIEEHVKQIT